MSLLQKVVRVAAPVLFFPVIANGQQAPAGRIGIQKEYVNEISRLAGDPLVKKMFTEITRLEPETRRDHITLTEIPAPPFKETERAKAFASMLEAAGVDTLWLDPVGNVVALRRGTSGKRNVVVDAHLDTVFPEGTDVKVKFSGDTLKAPGIGDDTRGLAALLAGLKALNRAAIKTDANVYFVGTVGEEGLGDLRGIKHLFAQKTFPIHSHIALDGVGIGGIVNSAVGSIRYRAAYLGPGGHSYGAFGLANPHHALAKAIAYFTDEANEFVKSGVKTTYNVGMIGGGTSVNAIPFESWLEVDMRSESPERLAGLDAIFRNAVEKALKAENSVKRMGEDLTVKLEKVGDRPSGSIPGTSPLVQRAAASAAHLGAVPMVAASSTNSNIPLSLGIPSVTIGSGGKAGGAHSLDEWWLNENGEVGIQHMLLVLLAEAGLAK